METRNCPSAPRRALVAGKTSRPKMPSQTYLYHWLSATMLTTLIILLTSQSVRTGGYLLPVVQAQSFSSLQPIFTSNMDSHTVRENTPVGEVVYQLEAKLTSDLGLQTKILYNIEGTQLFSVDKTSGQVRVAQPIDRESTGDQVTFQVSATVAYLAPGQQQQQYGPVVRLTTTVLIVDENDNAPRIERVRIGERSLDAGQLNHHSNLFGFLSSSNSPPVVRASVSESAPAGHVIVDMIEAIDVDKASQNPLRCSCVDCEPEFELRSAGDSLLNDRLNSSIVLVSQLTHVPRNNVRQLHVIVSDGKLNSSIMFEVTIDDVQNRPPQFTGSTTCIVHENAPIDRTIMTIQAIDGDVMGPDDSMPTKQQSQHQGRLILYDLVGTEQQSASENLKLHPLTGQLQVANKLDREAYLSSNGVLSIRVRARELTVNSSALAAASIREDDLHESILDKSLPFIDQSAEATSEIDIAVILVDVNDNEPHWLDPDEIRRLNINQSPDWFASLPRDRDTGRIYQLQVKENSLAGSPITFRNEMFVYDLDSGENADFNLSIKDPFHLFDVEPKQVSGFALVTLKLAGQGKRQKLLDYENPNERSFIIQLVATETSTRDGFRSVAQVNVSVLDVNDNAPEFRDASYQTNVREDAPVGKSILLVQATDKDQVSRSLSYSLHGKTAHFFDINKQSGLVSVARCLPDAIDQPAAKRAAQRQAQAASGPPRSCLDYEQQRSHHLMVEASDGELTAKVPLTVHVEDASDNPPVFSLPVIDAVIEEGVDRLDPPIRIEATDLDQSSVVTYSIVEGNFEGLFSINNATGELQLTRPIRIPHDDQSMLEDYRQQQLNKMTLVVQATDGEYVANGTIRIDVLDSNDNAPEFVKPQYSADIPETAAPGQTVVSVRAIDADRGSNAKVSYRIERGSFNQFEIEPSTGLVSVARSARDFDASARANYTLEVVAFDHGLVSRSSSVLVHVRVLDTIRRVPEFDPQVQRVFVSESTLNNSVIYKMTVAERDSASVNLIFEPGPIEALDKNGQQVSGAETERLESMFSVSTNTGDVMVNSPLDHDFAAHINLTIYVSSRYVRDPTVSGTDGAGDQMQLEETMTTPRSVGFLIINVVDDNTNAPIFAAPWSPQQPELSFQMAEELPVGSVLAQLVASDVDSKISHFKIEPANEYFELSSPQSGVIVNRRLIDYDALMSLPFKRPGSHRSANNSSAAIVAANIIQFNVLVFDSGTPQLSAKATVSAEITPVNDCDCKFERQLYEARVKENSPTDWVVAQVRAIDLDYGEQHNSVRYQLVGEHSGLFNIDPKTGAITVSANGSSRLDRERLSQQTLTLTVVGRDEQNLNRLAATYVLPSKRQSALQHQSTSRSCLATVVIHVDDVNDNPPLFSQKLYEVTAYDTDAIDVPLVKLIIRDDDLPQSSALGSANRAAGPTNSFEILTGNINNTFNITSSGLIYATKPLNETFAFNSEPIQLRVKVKQHSLGVGGSVLLTDDCVVRVSFIKINRFVPEWRPETLKTIAVEENAKPGTLVTQLRCTDRDHESKSPSRISDQDSEKRKSSGQSSSSPIRYYIKENGSNVIETAEFKLNPVTGNLVTRVELDHERQEYHQLIVTCEDNGKPQSLESISPIYIRVVNVDDNKPEFLVPKIQESSNSILISASSKHVRQNTPVIQFTIEEHQSRGISVGELKAIDRDLTDPNPMSYCIIDGNDFQEFSLDRVTGMLYTNQTLDRERQSTYDLLISATNQEPSTTCEDQVALYSIAANNTISIEKRNSIPNPEFQPLRRKKDDSTSLVIVRVDVLDINDNPPVFRRPVYRAGAQHRSLMNTLVTQVVAMDPDSGLNGTLNYRISETLMYKTAPVQQVSSSRKYDVTVEHQPLSKPIKLIQSPFKIDQQGNIYTQQMLTQYQLMSMFELQIEATEQAEPWRSAVAKLEIYLYETSQQLKMRINLHPRLVDAYKLEIEALLSNATKYTAIINRARSYHGSLDSGPNTNPSKPQQYPASLQRHRTVIDTLNLPNGNSMAGDERSTSPSFSNIHSIFVDNYRIVNPNSVMEKFDLTSAQLFMPQLLNLQSISQNGGQAGNPYLTQTDANGGQLPSQQSQQANEMTSLIDKIALASVQTSDYSTSASGLVGIDWLESPSVILVTLATILTFIGFIVCLIGCCCTSRIKDHIIRVAMNKLVEQQNIQAKINERVLANANGENGGSSQQILGGGQDYLLQQGGYMSSFDATKGCINNNNENMNILQRAMETGEYIDPNYTTLNGRVNLGAHYYDATDLEHQQQKTDDFYRDSGNLEAGTSKQVSDFRTSSPINLDDSHEDPDGDLIKMKQQQKLMTSGNGIQRQRQQVPQ